jgi:hypothetical protein
MQTPDDERVIMNGDEDVRYEEVEVGNGKPSLGGLRSLLVPVLVSIIVAFGMIQFWAMPNLVTKSDFTENLGNVTTDVQSMKNSLGNYVGLSQMQDYVSAQLGAYVPNSQLSSYVKTSDLSNNYVSNSRLAEVLNNYLETGDMSSYVTSSYLQNNYVSKFTLSNYNYATIEKLLEEIAKLEDRIEELEEGAPVSGLSISSFTPSSGTSGTVVTIYGNGFTGVTNVTFDGVSATNVNVVSPTEIKATVGSGATGYITVYTTSGTVTSTSMFTYGSGGGTVTGVTTTYVPTGLMGLPNSINISVTNNSGHDIFGGQFSVTIQYLDALPSSTNLVVMSSTEITDWTTGSISGVSLTKVGTASGVFILDGQTRIITVDITPPPIGTQFRVTNVTYTGWMY